MPHVPHSLYGATAAGARPQAPALAGFGIRGAFGRAAETCRVSYRGVLLALAVAAAARFVSDHYGAPAMLFALLFGIAFNFLSTDERCAPGIELSSKTLLRAGVALLGFRLSLTEIASLGADSLLRGRRGSSSRRSASASSSRRSSAGTGGSGS